MGDMADYYNEQIETEEEFRSDYGAGGMDPIEAFELGIIDERGFEYGTEGIVKFCRCCKKGNLHWGLNLKKWRLFEEDGAIHDCPAVPLPKTLSQPVQNNQQPKTKRGKPMQRN